MKGKINNGLVITAILFFLFCIVVLPVQAAQKPVADFYASTTYGDAPLKVRFTDYSTGDPLWWWWSFGDGSSSKDSSPRHTYSEPGIYTVSLKVKNAAGSDKEIKTKYITVKPSAKITFSSSVDSSVVSPYTLNVIKQILTNTGLTSAKITSTIRTPQKQAEIMYANCERTGPKIQKDIYAPAGEKVIDVYIEGKSEKLTKAEIIENMVSEINNIWPERVSLHCVPETQYSELNVLDISQSSISNSKAFKKQLDIAEKNGLIKKYLIENGCYHLEIPVK